MSYPPGPYPPPSGASPYSGPPVNYPQHGYPGPPVPGLAPLGGAPGYPSPSGYSGQPSYPGHPGGYPPPPGYPQPLKPSGTSAIFAGVLGVLGATAATGLLVFSVFAMVAVTRKGDSINSSAWLIAVILIVLVEAVLLGWGSVALLRRRARGPAILAVGCGVSVLLIVVTSIRSLFVGGDLDAGTVAGDIAFAVIGSIFPIVTLILALLPSTRRWVAAPR